MSNTVYVVSVQWTGLPGKKKARKKKLLHRKISGGEEIEGSSAASPQPLGLLAVVPSA